MKNYVSNYWDKRILNNDPLSAVLTLDAPACLNEAYDKWERYSLFSSIKTTLKNKKVLDVGCGYGRISLDFVQQGAFVTAIDISQKMLKMLEKKIDILNLNKKVTTVHTNSINFLIDYKFDMIICFGLLEHLSPKNRNESIINCFKHLKKSGSLYLILNNSKNPLLNNLFGNRSAEFKGYNSQLIGLNWVEKICNNHKMSYKIVASNPNYALLHYFFYKQKKYSPDSLIQLSLNALKADILSETFDTFSEIYASHFLVKISYNNYY